MKDKEFWGKEFSDISKSKGYIVKKPTQRQFKRFINFLLVGKGLSGAPQTVSISLKSQKKDKNKDKFNDKWVWIELKTNGGESGWLFGDSDFIVFESSMEYVFVPRKKLIEYVLENVDMDSPFVQNTWEAKYGIYQRNGKLDQICLVKLPELKKINNSYTWKK
jgi:hypothetical protein